MKKIIRIVDLFSFAIFAPVLAAAISVVLALPLRSRRRRRGQDINRFSFAIADMISNKYPAMTEDALLDGYIRRDYYIYLDFNNKKDRFEKIGDKIFFYSISAHPDSAVCRAGFKRVSSLMVELKILYMAFFIIWKNKITFIKAHDPHLLGLNGLIMARLFMLPCALHMNSNFAMKYIGTGKVSSPVFVFRSIERLFESAVMKSYDIIMADRKFYFESGAVPAASLPRYRVFGVRVDKAHYAEAICKNSAKEKLGLSDKKVLVYAGRLHPVKYPEDAIKAFGIVRGKISDAILVIAGDGILKERLVRLAKEMHLENDVLFLGQRMNKELAGLLRAADVMLAPHGGVTLLEAALASIPVVAYDFDWHPEFLEDGKMGFLVNFRDEKGMAEACLRLLSDEPLRRNFGEYARGVAMSRYGRNSSLERERCIYDELLRG